MYILNVAKPQSPIEKIILDNDSPSSVDDNETYSSETTLDEIEGDKSEKSIVKQKRLIGELIKAINEAVFQGSDSKKAKKKCSKVFGSMYGVKCYNKKEKANTRSDRESYNKNRAKLAKLMISLKHYYTKKPFVDLTRQFIDDSEKEIESQKRTQTYTPNISLDYIDFSNLRAQPNAEKKKPSDTAISLDYIDFEDLNKADTRRAFTKKEKKIIIDFVNNYKQKKRFCIVDNKGDEIEIEEKKPTRFQVVERYVRKPGKVRPKKKKLKVEAGSLYPPKVTAPPEITRRQRLPYFLPKGYDWKHDDIHDMSYYWFNGAVDRNSREYKLG